MTANLSDIDDLIRKEADDILFANGLLSVLKNFGTPLITGSYALKLMTWRDLDIYLETENISEKVFFALGVEIHNRFNPVKMSYRNERITQTQGLPVGLYWGIYFGNERKGAWKIDIWAVNAQECRQRLQFCDDIAQRLTPLSRQIILDIKSQCWQDPEYRRSYSSNDIYEAVLDKGITTIENFRKYLKSKNL
jgi:hypothetical protein